MALGSDRELVPLGAGFDVVKRGYSHTQVEEHLERLDADLRLMAADRDAAVSTAQDLTRQLERTRTELEEMRRQVHRLSLPPSTLEGLSERLQRMLRLAQDEASETKARAEAEAGHIRARAEADATSLHTRYQKLIAELDGRRTEMEGEHRAVMSKAAAELATKAKEAEAERARADAEAAAKHKQAEDDFEVAMSARRAEAMQVLDDQLAAKKTDTEQRLREATEQATSIRTQITEEQRTSKADAEQRLREATEQATSIRTQVTEEQRTSKADAEQRLREAT
ncbi:MAG: chromosome segregation protein, partial [Solirubrobacteraceae bacterium]